MIISNIEQKEIFKGIKARFIHTVNNTIGFIKLDEGAVLAKHSHIHEQTTIILEGKLEMTIDGKTKTFKPGMIAMIPSNISHSAKAITKCKVTDVFYPVREDYR